MDATGRYLDAIKSRLNIPSDYALAAHWNVTRQSISDYRRGVKTLGDDRCMEVARILDLPPEQVLLEIQADRARKQGHHSIADILERVLKRLAHAPAILAGLCLSLCLLTMPKDSDAMTRENADYAAGLTVPHDTWHYVKSLAAVFIRLFLLAWKYLRLCLLSLFLLQRVTEITTA